MAFKHGASGYRHHGCKCPICTDSHAAEQRRRREKVNGGPGLSVVHGAFPAFPADDPVERGPLGTTAATVEAEIEDMSDRAGIWTKECARLESQAMAAAKIVDELIGSGRVHLVPPHYRLVSQAMAELKQILAPARFAGTRTAEDEQQAVQAEIEAEFGGPLGSPDPDDPFHRRGLKPTTWNGHGDRKDRSTWGTHRGT